MQPTVSVVAERWAVQQCRIEDGLYFPDDTHVPFSGFRPSGERQSVDVILAQDADGWTVLDPVLLAEDGAQIWGGETSWEGEGFLAVCDPDGSLKWLFHCETSEPFVSAELRDGVVLAVSSEYPRRLEWRFPLDAPWTGGVTSGP